MASTNSSRSVWIGLAGLSILACLVSFGRLSGVDQMLAASIGRLRAPSLDGLMRAITFFGSAPWTAIALLGIGVWSFRSQGGGATLVLLGVFLIGLVLIVVLRFLVPHWRPDVATVPASMSWVTHARLSSFPSGHGYRSAFVFGWLARQWRGAQGRGWRLAAVGSMLLIVLVGISRVYLNRHWSSDVLGSWLLAVIALALARRGTQT